jgi:dTDP-glucose 4,6-dehydratase
VSNEVYPVNIGNQDEITMLQLAKEVIELAGSRSKIVFKDLPEDDPKVRQPDTTRAQTILQWKARIDRKEGLKRTIEYFRSQIR